jgi:arylsulfatase A-like enzyme
VPPEWANKYAGRFADGWDAQREAILERQKQSGVAPADAELTPRPDVGRVDQTQPMIFSADETTDIGDDVGMPVSADYAGASRFNGRIDVVQIDLGEDDHPHLIDPAEVARIAVSRQ